MIHAESILRYLILMVNRNVLPFFSSSRTLSALHLDRSFGIGDIPSLNKITLKIDHSDGRQLTLSLSSATTLKSLYQQVAEGLGLPAVSLVFNDQTLKLDEHHQSMSLKQLQFSSDNVQSLESYPVINKLKIYIQTSSSMSRMNRIVGMINVSLPLSAV